MIINNFNYIFVSLNAHIAHTYNFFKLYTLILAFDFVQSFNWSDLCGEKKMIPFKAPTINYKTQRTNRLIAEMRFAEKNPKFYRKMQISCVEKQIDDIFCVCLVEKFYLFFCANNILVKPMPHRQPFMWFSIKRTRYIHSIHHTIRYVSNRKFNSKKV